MAYDIKSVPLPTGYKGIIVGSYTDEDSRILEITVRPPAGKYFMFPTEPGGLGSLQTGVNTFVPVALDGVRKGPVAGQWIVRVDRGYEAEFNGDPQPEGAYALPLTGGLLLNCSAASICAETYEWALAANEYFSL